MRLETILIGGAFALMVGLSPLVVADDSKERHEAVVPYSWEDFSREASGTFWCGPHDLLGGFYCTADIDDVGRVHCVFNKKLTKVDCFYFDLGG